MGEYEVNAQQLFAFSGTRIVWEVKCNKWPMSLMHICPGGHQTITFQLSALFVWDQTNHQSAHSQHKHFNTWEKRDLKEKSKWHGRIMANLHEVFDASHWIYLYWCNIIV